MYRVIRPVGKELLLTLNDEFQTLQPYLFAKTPHIWRPYKLALLYLYSSWIIPVTNFTHIQSSFLDRDPAGLFMMQGQRVGPFCVGTFYCHHNWASLSVFRGVSRIISGGLVTCATKYPNRPLRNQNLTFWKYSPVNVILPWRSLSTRHSFQDFNIY